MAICRTSLVYSLGLTGDVVRVSSYRLSMMRFGDLDTGEQLYTAREIADRAGIRLSTWQAYVSRRQAPDPDVHAERTPLWLGSTIDRWLSHRRDTR